MSRLYYKLLLALWTLATIFGLVAMIRNLMQNNFKESFVFLVIAIISTLFAKMNYKRLYRQ